MLILADENIPGLLDAFGPLGRVVTRPGRSIGPADVRAADALLVRSVTRVDQALLAGSRVRFVGSATIGTDHVDRPWLDRAGIAFANAPGCNAVSAAEWTLAALCVSAGRTGRALAGRRALIVGCGQVGSRVRARLTALGVRCAVNDPPRESSGIADDYAPLSALGDFDLVTLHTPLTRAGPHPTFHLADEPFLRRLRRDAVLVNCARGAVVDNAALLRIALQRPDLALAFDVWEGEPRPDPALVARAALATPHIAGYSIDGKLRGTAMIHAAFCRHFGIEAHWDGVTSLPAPGEARIDLPAAGTDEAAVRAAVRLAYAIERDDRALRAVVAGPMAARASGFDALRRDYPVRREFAAYRVRLLPERRALGTTLAALGFVCQDFLHSGLPQTGANPVTPLFCMRFHSSGTKLAG